VVLLEENQNYSRVLTQGPFESYLARTYGTAVNFYSILHGSNAAYMAATSGTATNLYPQDVRNLGDLADASGVSWAAFEQGMPTPCNTSVNWTDLYDPNHNPFIMFNDTVQDAPRCAAHDLTWSSWTSDVSAGTIPAYSFITPNIINDERNTSIPVGDAWLQSWLSPLVNDSAIFSHTAFLISYDEDGGSPSNTPVVNGSAGGHIYTVVVSPYSNALSSDHFYTTFSLLTTAEWLLGIPGGTLGNDSWSLHPPMMDLFCFQNCSTTGSHPAGFSLLNYGFIGLVLIAVAVGLAILAIRSRKKTPPQAPLSPPPVAGESQTPPPSTK
jgi:hypothetical protein